MIASSDLITTFESDHRADWFKFHYREVRKAIALRQLEGKVARIITVSNGHRKNNVPKHSEVFGALAKQADEAITKFCTTFEVNTLTIYTQMPALKQLQDWGSPAPASASPFTKAIGIVIASIIGIFALGWASGIIQRVFHFGWTVAHYHLP